MGQAVVDLPDPTEQPPAGGNADDLLSQLAGDEIDRLLGEAEVEKAAQPPAADAAAPALDPTATVGETPADAAVEPAVDIAKQVEEAKAEIEAVAPAETPTPVAPAASSDLDHAIAAHADRVLGPSTAVEAPTEHQELLAGDEETVDEAAPTPLLLRPLEWLSSPLDTLSPGTRDFLGKAAIVTLVNSAAVIAYVIWFRK
jgi:hypothetical protein